MQKRNWAVVCIALASVAGFWGIAKADTVITASITAVIPFSPFANLSLDGNTVTGAVGEIIWNGAGEGNPSPYNGTFTTYCLDLTDAIGLNTPYTFTVQPDIALAPKSAPMGATQAAEMDELFGQQYGLLSTQDDYQAFQLAIWNIVYDTDTSVEDGEGEFYVEGGNEDSALDTSTIDSTAITEADDWLDDAASPTDQALYGDDDDVVALTGSEGIQDQIMMSTPLPSTAMCGGVLMIGLGLARWMSSRAAKRAAVVAG
jgi:hypothetical protein